MSKFFLSGLSLFLSLTLGISAQGIIIDHTCTDLSQVPDTWIQQAKTLLKVTYGHTSHGSQLVTGMSAMRGSEGSLLYFTSSGWGYNANVFLNDEGMPGASDLGSPNRTAWATATRTLLNRSGGCNRNVVIWSWCGQVDGSAAEITTYLNLMSQLEADFPGVKFVYMTGHLNGTGAEGNVNQRNAQIRSFCRTHNKILFDFADIESYDPDGLTHYMPLYCTDGCDYDSDGNGSQDKNWASSWIAANPGNPLTSLATGCDSCAHSERLNCILKGRAFWWLMARLAGWNGSVDGSLTLVAPNGGESWRLGESRQISWSSIGVSGNLIIELLQGGVLRGVIMDEVPVADGAYTWVTGRLKDNTVVTGSNMTIRIRSQDGKASDQSSNL